MKKFSLPSLMLGNNCEKPVTPSFAAKAMEPSGPWSAWASRPAKALHSHSLTDQPWDRCHELCSGGCPQGCWEQPGTHCMDWLSAELSGTTAHTQPSLPGHIPPAEAPWTALEVAGSALGTLFSSRADQGNEVRMLSLLLQASGCCYNENGQIN